MKDSKVLVIGGGSGLGLGIAKECSRNGAQVIIASRSEEKLKHSISEISDTAKYQVVDILSDQSIASLFENIGEINHLVVTSGFVTAKQFDNLSEEDARTDFETNFWGKFNIAKYASKQIKEGGSITFISGAFATKPNPDVFMTSISVSAVETMAKMLAISLSPIRVNVISPYIIDTDLVGSGRDNVDRKEFLASTANNLPAKCIGSPKDIGDAAVLLMSNPYITGSTLSVDGGFSVI